MDLVVEGDVIFHYAAGHLRAVGVAYGAQELAHRPYDLPAKWSSDGRLLRVEMTDIDPPIPRLTSTPWKGEGTLPKNYLDDLRAEAVRGAAEYGDFKPDDIGVKTAERGAG
jgi:hypothetical protein